MANSALFMGWNRAIAGREQQAMDLFMKCLEYYGQLQSDGKIESFEPVILSAHGGDLNGFVLLRGDVDKLEAIRQEETFISYSTEANFILEGFGLIRGYIGDSITEAFSEWAKYIR